MNANLCLMISSEIRQGARYVSAKVMQHEEGKNYPTGLYIHEKAFLEGLEMEGFVSEYSGFLMHDVRFLNVYAFNSITMAKALKALQKVELQMERDHAREPGDMFRCLALALGIKQVCVTEDGTTPKGYWASANWQWMSAEEGRVAFRRMASDAHAEWERSKKKEGV